MYYPLTFRTLLVLFCAVCFAACRDEQVNPPTSEVTHHNQSSVLDRVTQDSRLWQRQFEAEHALRLQAEVHLSQKEAARTWWQTTATILAVAAVVLLGLGATLGSAALHESQKS